MVRYKYAAWQLIASTATLCGLCFGSNVRAEEPEDAINSVITSLELQKDAVEKALSEELSPQRQKIHEAFSNTVGALDDVIIQLQRDPKNAELRKKYEETVSSALTQAGDLLGEYVTLREPTRRKLNGLATTLTQAQKACTEQVEEHRIELARHAEQKKSVESKLAELAEKHRVVLTSGQGQLPRDVEFQIRLLEVDLAVARQNAQFSELAIRDFETVQADVEAQAEELANLKSSLEVTFIQAEGQQQLLTRITDLRTRRTQAMRLGANVAQMQPLVARATQQNDKVNELIQRFMDHDFRPRTAAARKSKSVAQRDGETSGVSILKKYLKPETEVTNVAK